MVVRELLIGLGFNVDNAKLKQADQGLEKLKATASTTAGAFSQLAAIIGVALGVREIIQAADEWTNMYSRIGLVTKSVEEQLAMQEKVYAIAQQTRQEYSTTADLYVKMARNSKELGASQQDVLDATETVNKALVIGGASTTEAKATILQLGQALASGRLAGDELRSISENAPLLFQAIADYYGVSIGKLKDMGAQGELTAEGIFKAILKAKAKTDKEFGKMPITVGQAVTYAMNRIGKMIFDINKETGVFQKLAAGIVRSADWIGGKMDWLAKKVGGYGNVVKLATILVTSFGAALIAIKWSAIAEGIALAQKALMVLLMSPAGWKFLAIAAAITAVALALEDLYTWITDGDSVIGDFLGPWDDFKRRLDATIGPAVKAMQDLAIAIEKAMNRYDELMIRFGLKKVPLGIAGHPYAERDMAAGPEKEGPLGIAGQQYAAKSLPWIDQVAVVTAKALKAWSKVIDGEFSEALSAANDFISDFFQIFEGIGRIILGFLLSKIEQFVTAIGEKIIGAGAAVASFFESAIAQASMWIESLKNGFFGAIDSIIQYFKTLLNEALSILQQIADAIGRFVLDKLSQAKSSLFDFLGLGNAPPPAAGGNGNPVSTAPPPYPIPTGVTPGTFANGIANRQITQTVTQQVSIEQNIAGSNLQPTAIGDSTAAATTDALGKMTRDWQFVM